MRKEPPSENSVRKYEYVRRETKTPVNGARMLKTHYRDLRIWGTIIK